MSNSEQEVLAVKFERHADEEGKILTEYRALSEQLGNSAAGNLISHILTEEELHHLLLRTLASWMREPATEHTRAIPRAANRAELLRLTQKLQKHELETINACRAAESELSRGNTLLGTLLDAMALDSQKHHRLLQAVEELLKD